MSILTALVGSVTTLSVLLLVTVDPSLTISCQEKTHSFPPDSCVSLLFSDGFKEAEDKCISDGLDSLAVLTDEQLTGTLSIYAASVLKEGQLLWIGYYFDVSGGVHASPSNTSVTSGSLLDGTNFNLTDAVDFSQTPCVAVDNKGAFHRRGCHEKLMALCQKKFEAPNASISIQGGGGRFIPEESNVILSCISSGTDVVVSWLVRKDSSSSQPKLSSNNGNIFNITDFSASDTGSYYCVATNSLGGFVSNPITLRTSGATSPDPTVTLTSSPSEGNTIFNAQLILTCSYDTAGMPVAVGVVQWFINGAPVDETNSTNSQSEMTVDKLVTDGYYQCLVVTQDGEAAGAIALVYPQPGVPSLIDQIIAEPSSNSSLSVSWFCSSNPATFDPILLRYEVRYNQGTEYNESLATSPLVILAVEGGDVLERCQLNWEITGLLVGTIYAVRVQAYTSSDMGETGTVSAVSSTYGLPPGTIQELKVFRGMDNKTVYGFWENVKTELPVGQVARYEIQYRQFLKNSINTVFSSVEFNYVTILNVVNADSYEIRVRAGIISRRNPLTYSYGEFSSWERVQGFTTDPPTKKGGLSGKRAGVIAAGVIVGVMILVAISAILIVGVVCIMCKRVNLHRWSPLRKSTNDHPLSQPISDE